MATGLLGDSWDDPRTSMMLALASGLLGGRGNLAQNLGAGLQAALPAYQSAARMRDASELHKAQMEKYRADALRAQAMAAKGINPDDPSDIRTWREFEKMTPEQKANFILSKRSDFALKDIEGVLNRVSLSGLGGTTPIEDLQRKGEAENFLAAMKSRGTEQEKANFDMTTGWNPVTRSFESATRAQRIPQLPPLISPGGPRLPSAGAPGSYGGMRGYMDPQEQQRAWRQFGESRLPGDQMQPVPQTAEATAQPAPAPSPGIMPKEQAELDQARVKTIKGMERALERRDLVIGKIDSAINKTGWTTAGIAGVTSALPMTPARSLQGEINTILANLGFDELKNMRFESPTGGALGQVAVQELMMLQATLSSLDIWQNPNQVRENLNIIKKQYVNSMDKLKTAIEEEKKYLGGGIASSGGGGAGGAGGANAASALRSEAEAAIKQGAPRDAVAKRFKERTGQDL